MYVCTVHYIVGGRVDVERGHHWPEGREKESLNGKRGGAEGRDRGGEKMLWYGDTL